MRIKLAQFLRACRETVGASRDAYSILLLLLLVTLAGYLASYSLQEDLERIFVRPQLVVEEEYVLLAERVRLLQTRRHLRLQMQQCEMALEMEAASGGGGRVGDGPSRETWERRLQELAARIESLEHLEAAHEKGETRLREHLRTLWDSLPEGSFAFKPQSRMRQGRPEYVIARLVEGPDPDLLKDLEEGYQVERIKVSSTMEAHLIGASDEFLIEPLSSVEQALLGGAKEWRWRVVALMPGEHRLFLRIVAQIRSPDDQMVRTDLLVKEAAIEVEVDRWWSAKTFVAAHWQWLLGSPVVLGGFCGWLLTRWKRKPRSAGFSP